MVSYEKFKFNDPGFPATFHSDKMVKDITDGFYLHWHEHLEILCLTGGKAAVVIDNNRYEVGKGETVIINSGALHSMPQKEKSCGYHCLILDKQFCQSFFFDIDERIFFPVVSDERVYNIMLRIASEMDNKLPHYKSQVQALAVELLTLLSREFVSASDETMSRRGSQQQKLVREAVSYISSHFFSELTVDEIAKKVGLSRYYFCRIFKEMTGQTAFDYINLLRCNNAQKLLRSGRYNISESAYASGFNNLSYFTRTYKKIVGKLPSQEVKQEA